VLADAVKLFGVKGNLVAVEAVRDPEAAAYFM
jgi:hypothetical protein